MDLKQIYGDHTIGLVDLENAQIHGTLTCQVNNCIKNLVIKTLICLETSAERIKLINCKVEQLIFLSKKGEVELVFGSCVGEITGGKVVPEPVRPY